MVGVVKRFIFIILGMLILHLPLRAQEPDSRAIYESLLVQRTYLNEKQQHIQTRLASTRRLFTSANGAEKEKYGAQIISLEEELFSSRSMFDKIAAEIRKYEDSGIISTGDEVSSSGTAERPSGAARENVSTGQGNTVSVTRPTTASLTATDYVRLSLPLAEYEQLLLSQAAETQVAAQLSAIKQNHSALAKLSDLYQNAEKGARADSLFSAMFDLAVRNLNMVESFSQVWSGVFDNKVYTYSYILDRENRSELLAAMERTMHDMWVEAADIKGDYIYDAVALYPLQKELIISYETLVAQQAGLDAVVDSLQRVRSGLERREYMLPYIDLSQRIFIDYSDFTVGNSPAYSNPNAIPATEIHPHGTVYRVFLGAFKSIQPLSIFRNVSPLSREFKEKLHHYYVGGYRTLEEVNAAAARLKTAGFRNPRPVVWVDGIYNDKPLPAVDSQGHTGTQVSHGNETTTVKAVYRIEIRGAGGALSASATEVIKEIAPGKEISRMADGQAGKYLFVVGFFNNKADAEELAEEISAVSGELNVGVVEIR